MLGVLAAFGTLLFMYEQELAYSLERFDTCQDSLLETNAALEAAQVQHLKLLGDAAKSNQDAFYRGAFALCIIATQKLDGYTKEQRIQSCLGVTKEMITNRVYERGTNDSQSQ